MGLLSPFLQQYYGQQQPFGPTPQMPQSPFAALQQPVPMPAMGAPQPAPFALNQPTAMPTLNQSPLGAGARGPSIGPKGPMEMGGGANKPGGFIGRLQSGFSELPNNSLFQMGMSLLGNAQNGGDWGQVGRDMQAFADRRRQQQQEDNQTRRAKVLEGRQDTAWSEREGQAAAFNQYLAGLSPEEAARVRAIGMEGLPDYIQGQQRLAIEHANMDRQERQFQQSLAIDRARLGLAARSSTYRPPTPEESDLLSLPDGGRGYLIAPDGRVVQIPGTAAARFGPDQRARVAISYTPALEATQQLEAAEQSAGRDTPFGRDWGARMVEGIVPWDGGSAARVVGGEDYTNYVRASSAFEAAILPILSGAAVTESEAQRVVRAALPRFGDSPATLEAKARQRRQMLNGAAVIGGRPLPYPEEEVHGVFNEALSGTAPATGAPPANTGNNGELIWNPQTRTFE